MGFSHHDEFLVLTVLSSSIMDGFSLCADIALDPTLSFSLWLSESKIECLITSLNSVVVHS